WRYRPPMIHLASPVPSDSIGGAAGSIHILTCVVHLPTSASSTLWSGPGFMNSSIRFATSGSIAGAAAGAEAGFALCSLPLSWAANAAVRRTAPARAAQVPNIRHGSMGGLLEDWRTGADERAAGYGFQPVSSSSGALADSLRTGTMAGPARREPRSMSYP